MKKVVIDVWAGRRFALKECFGMGVGKPFCKGPDRTILIRFAGHISFLLNVIVLLLQPFKNIKTPFYFWDCTKTGLAHGLPTLF